MHDLTHIQIDISVLFPWQIAHSVVCDTIVPNNVVVVANRIVGWCVDCTHTKSAVAIIQTESHIGYRDASL